MFRTIGIDLDNTLINYDRAFYATALDQGYIAPDIGMNKQTVRDRVRSRPDGESLWQWLQARVYGPEIGRAQLMTGAMDFLQRCHRLGIRAWIISHKSRFAAAAPDGCDLRNAALAWLEQQQILDEAHTGLGREAVCFADTRGEKLQTIASCGCELFVDDLLEVLTEPAFPPTVRRLWLSGRGSAPEGIQTCRNWFEVGRAVFDDG